MKNWKFLWALVIASGMAFAQASGSAGQTGSQGTAGGTATTGGAQQQTPDQSTQTPATTQNPSSTTQPQSSATSSSNGQQTTMRGCLKQAGGNWTLATDNGQTVNVSGDDSTLKPNDAHQVEISGTQAADGSLQVSSVNVISDTCTNQQGAGSMGTAATGAAAGRGVLHYLKR